MRCTISDHLYNLNNVKNTHGGKLQAKWYQIAQRITYVANLSRGVLMSLSNIHDEALTKIVND